jgi:hypothetical protein
MTTASTDELFEILSNSRRRHLIYYLFEAGGEMSLTRLATKIAAAEDGTDESAITPDERQRVYISLYQTHLPKLEAGHVVSYDGDERVVALTDEVREDGFFWMATEDPSTSWFRLYVALAAGSWVALALAWLSGAPLSPVGWPGAALVVSVGLSVLVTLQYLDERGDTPEGPSGHELLVDRRSGENDAVHDPDTE